MSAFSMAHQMLHASCSAMARGQQGMRRPVVAAGLLGAASAAGYWAPPARAEPQRGIRSQAAPGRNAPPAPWESKPADDGLDPVRQRIREYGCRPVEEKLLSVLREFNKDEAEHLKNFANAEAEADDKMLRIYHSFWKRTTGEKQLLLTNPREFVQQYGYKYDIEVPERKKFFFFF